MVVDTAVLSSAEVANQPDVLVVGGGIAGAALAAFLGRHGRRVLVLERDLEAPERIVGELLQPGGVAAMKEMELESMLMRAEKLLIPVLC